MKNFKALILFLCLTLSVKVYSKVEVYDFKRSQFYSLDTFASMMSPSGQYILGEFHYNDKIQKAQADFIGSMVKGHEMENNFDVHWEFLNYTDQPLIRDSFQRFQNNEISAIDFLTEFSQGNATSYQPILETIKKLGGHFSGVNAPRNIKKKIIKEGIESIDPSFIPPNMALGSDLYFEKFKEAMGGHINEDQLMGYYTAQCYTDSVMAYYVNQFSLTQLSFLVVGSFHSDYGLGTVAALKKFPNSEVHSLKFVDKSELTDEELRGFMTQSGKFGAIADFLILID